MTQTNRSRTALRNLTHLLALLLLGALMAACTSTGSTVSKTGPTRVGASVGSTGGVTGIGTSIKPNMEMITHKDLIINGPSSIRRTHKEAVETLKSGNYATAGRVFEDTLKAYPDHPDATYFLGITRIYQGKREAGFTLLKSYRDREYYRMTQEVRRMAAFLEQELAEGKKLTAMTIHNTMNRYRTDGYNRDQNELKEHRTKFF